MWYNIIVTGFVPRLWANDVMKDLRGWYAILSNCEREAWKKFRLQRDSNPWPLRYRCSALPTELWSHNCWEKVNFSGSIMPLRVIQHYSDWVCTAVMSKWRHERSSRLIRNLSNCEREAWKKFRLQRDLNPWPLWYRCSALPTELWSHNCWEKVNFSGSIMPLRVIQHYSDWICTAVMSKWCHERSLRLIRNLSNCEREAWKKFRLQQDSNPWPLRYRCSAQQMWYSFPRKRKNAKECCSLFARLQQCQILPCVPIV